MSTRSDLWPYRIRQPANTLAVVPAAANPPAHRSWSFRLGRLAGIDIRVHATFFLLVALFALAGTEAGSPGVVSSLSWLIVIFTCVVVHELAHCVVGRARGAVVEEIVLLPIGGVSKLEHLPETPSDELAMAIAGPLASIGLAALGGLAAVLAQESLVPIDLYGGAFLARVFWFNLVIAAFNLLPAFPLDGGRVFRALLERRFDLERATRIAATVGRTIAVFLVVVGLVLNLWLTIIGIFVFLGASAEEAATIVHVRLRGHRVGDVMMLEPVILPATTSAAELRALVRRSAQRAFPVVGELGYLGLVDARSVELDTRGQSAVELAERDAPVVAATDELEEDLPLVVRAPARALVVVDGRRVVGVLRLEDVQHLVTETEVYEPSDEAPESP